MAKRTIGDIADEILVQKLEIQKQTQALEALEEGKKKLEEELKLAADAAGLTSGGGKNSKFTIDEQTLPQISDIDSFYKYIKDNNYFHLLQRRPAVKACQELWSQGSAIPGIDKFTQMKVNVKGA